MDGFDVVDSIEVPLPTCTFVESTEHTGVLGIATVRLGYSFVSFVNQSTTGNVREGEGVSFTFHFQFEIC